MTLTQEQISHASDPITAQGMSWLIVKSDLDEF